jgi:hypothetical protein
MHASDGSGRRVPPRGPTSVSASSKDSLPGIRSAKPYEPSGVPTRSRSPASVPKVKLSPLRMVCSSRRKGKPSGHSRGQACNERSTPTSRMTFSRERA